MIFSFQESDHFKGSDEGLGGDDGLPHVVVVGDEVEDRADANDHDHEGVDENEIEENNSEDRREESDSEDGEESGKSPAGNKREKDPESPKDQGLVSKYEHLTLFTTSQ